tara:strand:+ start:181 stop:525 length:345 start_codon:yes stop_codon:yes gene_type:complete
MYPSPVDSLRQDIQNLAAVVGRLVPEVEQCRQDISWMIESSPDSANLYLRPSEFGKLTGVSAKTISKYRYEGYFRDISVRKVKLAKRTDYYYHRINAVEDLSKRRPIHLKKKVN